MTNEEYEERRNAIERRYQSQTLAYYKRKQFMCAVSAGMIGWSLCALAASPGWFTGFGVVAWVLLLAANAHEARSAKAKLRQLPKAAVWP